MLDKATVLTTIFTIVDDTMRGAAMIQQALERPGPAPSLSDSEVVSIALYQELIGEPREDHFFRLQQASLRTFFPGLKLHSVVSLTGVLMGFVLTGASHYDNQAVVELLDSFAHHLKCLLGDGAYNDAALQHFLGQYRSVDVLAPVKRCWGINYKLKKRKEGETNQS